MEIPRLRGQVRTAAEAYATDIDMPDLSCIGDYAAACGQILKAPARPGIEPISSWTLCCVLNPLSHTGNSQAFFVSIQPVCVSFGAVIPFTFKVIISMYVLTAI